MGMFKMPSAAPASRGLALTSPPAKAVAGACSIVQWGGMTRPDVEPPLPSSPQPTSESPSIPAAKRVVPIVRYIAADDTRIGRRRGVCPDTFPCIDLARGPARRAPELLLTSGLHALPLRPAAAPLRAAARGRARDRLRRPPLLPGVPPAPRPREGARVP